MLYFQGNGVAKSEYKAFEYLQKAARQGDTMAEDNIRFLCKKSPWVCK